MALFKKKESDSGNSKTSSSIRLPNLPDLPDLPSSHDSQVKGQNSKSLPSFPNSETGNDLSQQAIKTAITSPQRLRSDIDYQESMPKEKRTFEIGEDEISDDYVQSKGPGNEQDRNIPLPHKSKPMHVASIPKPTKKIEPVYIRIDKFKSAVETFEEIKSQVADVEDLLKQIKEVKRKEEQELKEWEKEIESIKAKMDSIDNNIFSKLS
jgi:hypothetical protein